MTELTDAELLAGGMLRATVDLASEGIFIEVNGHFAYLSTTAVRLFEAASAGELTILVVDDMAGIRGLLRKVLTGAGYKVIEAADGKQALQQMRTSQVDLLLTDLVMPEKDGIEAIRTIHMQWPELKIIAMSGEFGGQFLHAAELLGANASLPKPVRPEVLLDVVRRVLP